MVEPEALVGQVVDGRWLLVDHLGSGRFGDVYAAEPRHLELSAGAVKVVRPRNDDERVQILREIQALSELSHDGLLGYRDAGEIHEGVLAGSVYIVTELCDGTIADEPGWAGGSGRFAAELAVAVEQLADALGYLHSRGFIHRDVKPANILRAGNGWKLSDFGLMRDQSEPVVGGGGVQGTAPYLAPETSLSAGAGAPADVYALGVVVHEALTGAWPYDPVATQWAGPPLNEGAAIAVSPDLPRGWGPLVELCLQVDPKRRPTAAEIPALVPEPVIAESFTAPASIGSRTRSVDTLPPPQGSSKRTKLLWTLIATAVVAVVGVVSLGAAILVAGLLTGDGEDQPVTDNAPTDTTPAVSVDDAKEADSTPVTSTSGAVATTTPADTEPLYVTEDLTLGADQIAPIIIAADNITLDCAGHTITGTEPGASNPRGIEMFNRTAVTVKNCNLIEAEFTVLGSVGNTLLGNETEGHGSGFNIIESDNNIFDRNTVIGGNSFGLNNSTGNLFTNNTVSNTGTGFNIFLGSVGNTFTDNILGDLLVGIADDSTGGTGTAGTDNTYTDNTCIGNGTASNPSGLCESGPSGTAGEDPFAGVWEWPNGDTTTVTAVSEDLYHVETFSPEYCADGAWVGSDTAVADDGLLTFDYVTTACPGGPDSIGKIYPDRTLTIDAGTLIHGRPEDRFEFTLIRTETDGQDACDGDDAASSPSGLCESTTTGEMVVARDTTLVQDHVGTVVIAADDVTLDCAGHRITGTGTAEDGSDGTGVLVDSRTGVTVENCHVTNFSTGLIVADSTATVLRDNSASGNRQGFEVARSTATLTDNVANDNASWGFFLSGDNDGTKLTGNAARLNGFIGYVLDNSSGNELDANRASQNGWDSTFFTDFQLSGSDGNYLSNNVTSGPGGFRLGGSDNNSFTDNTANRGLFWLNRSSGNTFTGNTATDNEEIGFYSFLGSIDNTFTGNTSQDNVEGFADASTGGSGTAGTDNTYVDNVCTGNSLPSNPVGLC